MIKNPFQILAAISILACSAFGMAADDAWFEIKSPNFIIISNASIHQARRVAKSLEQFRAVLQSTLPTLKVDPGYPLFVFAARDGLSLQALLPKDRQEEGAMQPEGFFLHGQGENIVVLRTDTQGNLKYHTIYHEYVHMAMNLNFRNLPLWLSEGLADLYSFATISKGASGLGRTNVEYLETLKTSAMIPLSTLMGVTRDSPYYHKQAESKVFYAQSWALTHYLILGDNRAHAGQLLEFLRLIKSDVPEKEAVERSFGDLQALQRNLETYIHSNKFYYFQVKTRFSVKENQYAARMLSSAESLALRGKLLARIGRLDEAKALLEKALQLDSSSAVANEGMGLLFLSLQNQELAQKYFSVAAELDSKSFLAQYYAAELALARNRDYKAAENYLRKALTLNPQFVPAYRTLSHILILQGARLSEAFELAMKAANLEPSESSNWINVGQILIMMRRDDEAKRLGERLLAIARTEAERRRAELLLFRINNPEDLQRNGARELETPLSNQDLASSASAVENGPSQSVEGLVRFVKCEDPAIMDVVLDSNGTQQRLHAGNYHQIQYWVGGDPKDSGFQPCAELEGMRVRIEFMSVPGQEYSGLIRTVVIEK